MNPHQEAFEAWLDKLKLFLLATRGRQTRLAQHLGVRRQSVHRWFIERRTPPPAWAAVAANIWYNARIVQPVPPQADK